MVPSPLQAFSNFGQVVDVRSHALFRAPRPTPLVSSLTRSHLLACRAEGFRAVLSRLGVLIALFVFCSLLPFSRPLCSRSGLFDSLLAWFAVSRAPSCTWPAEQPIALTFRPLHQLLTLLVLGFSVRTRRCVPSRLLFANFELGPLDTSRNRLALRKPEL